MNYCKTHDAVPIEAETLKLIEEDIQRPTMERFSWWALMLPAIDDHEIEISTQTRTHLSMDYLSYYPFLGFYNTIVYSHCVPIFLKKIATQNLDLRIIVERVFSDGLTDPIKMEIDEESSEWQYSILVQRAYAFYQLVQDPKVQDILVELPYNEKLKMDGKTFLSIFSDLGERIDRELGAFPWFEEEEESYNQSEIICEIGKLYFKSS